MDGYVVCDMHCTPHSSSIYVLARCRCVSRKRKKLSTTLIYKWKCDVNFGPFSFEMYPCPGHLKMYVIALIRTDRRPWTRERMLSITHIHSKLMTILVWLILWNVKTQKQRKINTHNQTMRWITWHWYCRLCPDCIHWMALYLQIFV